MKSEMNFERNRGSAADPYPVGDVNAYLIESESLLLDTEYLGKSLAALSAALASLGRKIEDLDNVVVTHHHFDHFGAAFHLSGLSARAFFITKASILYSQNGQEDYVQSFLGRCGYSKDYLLLGRELSEKANDSARLTPPMRKR
jgi:glyoxylase-like metal-dependent hydrolase (beta-lactamase superfamily II)